MTKNAHFGGAKSQKSKFLTKTGNQNSKNEAHRWNETFQRLLLKAQRGLWSPGRKEQAEVNWWARVQQHDQLRAKWQRQADGFSKTGFFVTSKSTWQLSFLLLWHNEREQLQKIFFLLSNHAFWASGLGSRSPIAPITGEMVICAKQNQKQNRFWSQVLVFDDQQGHANQEWMLANVKLQFLVDLVLRFAQFTTTSIFRRQLLC